MAPRIIDLSVPIANDIPADPPGYELNIDYVSHKDTLKVLHSRYKDLDENDLPGAEAFAVEYVKLSTHNGTHVDSPWHYSSTMSDGSRSRTIDELPLDWFFRPGVKLDFRHLADGHVVQPSDIDEGLDRIGYELKPYDIVLINTSAGAHFGEADFTQRGCGMGRDATLHLTSKGVRVAGTDAWGWDVPIRYMIKRFEETGDASIIWEGHKAGREREYCHIEKLHNLASLPATGFTVACFPVKIQAASGGWTRAVALLDE